MSRDTHMHQVIASLRNTLAEQHAGALLVTVPENVRYVSGFSSPEDGRVLITAERVVLITDGRYDAQSKEETSLDTVLYNQHWQKQMIEELLPDAPLVIEAEGMTVAERDYLDGLLHDAGKPQTVPSKGLLTQHRLMKTESEIATLRQAAQLTDAAFSHILDFMKVGMQEVEVALELERFMRLQGAEGVAFPIIVASGYRSAMPHGVASTKKIENGELVTIDMGAKLDGYHADMTRTVVMGEISPRDKTRYQAVLEAQEAGLAAVRAGIDGAEADEAAREVLRSYGLESYYPHGLGHGVGLEIHEDPRLSTRATGMYTLKPNMMVTVEPGVYVPGESGVRIEDLVRVTEEGCERLSHSPKELISLPRN